MWHRESSYHVAERTFGFAAMTQPGPPARRRPPLASLRPAALLAAVPVLALLAATTVIPRPRPARAADPEGRAPTATVTTTRTLGAGSCAARGCHGGVGGGDPTGGDVAFAGGEYTTWRTYDPHARAFEVLRSARSRRMAERLADRLQHKPAHEAPACLSCHDPRSVAEASPRLTHEGVGCESCHGPAERWREPHLAARWRTLPAADKARLGMADLSDPVGRASTCVGCHVGDRDRGREVNHDLIAAGHPRLDFELTSAVASLPRHWRDPDDPTAAIRAWAVGEAVTARAGVDLLASRAGAAARPGAASEPWPEFSEYGCFACHRNLPDHPGPPVDGGANPPGSPLPWGVGMLAVLPTLAQDQPGVDPDSPQSAWAPLRRAMTRDEPDAGEVANAAARASAELDAWIPRLGREPFDRARVDAILQRLAVPPSVDPPAAWDAATRRYLGLRALTRSRSGGDIPPEVRSALDSAPKLLNFPAGYDSPRQDPRADHPDRAAGAAR